MSDMNSSSGTSVYRISPLHGTENFNTWRIQMEDILTDLGLFDYVSGTSQFPPYDLVKVPDPTAVGADGKPDPNATKEVLSTTMNKEQEKWIKEDRKALSQIRLRVDAHALTHIQSCNYSREAWSLLMNTFQVQGTVGLIDLRRKFFSHRMTDGEDVEEHMRKMRDWFQQINIILPQAISEVDWITTLVASLPDSWDSFTQSVDFNFDFKNANLLNSKVADLRSRILAEAHRRNTRGDNGKSFYSNNRPNFSNGTRSFNPTKAPSRTPDKSQSKCNNCGRTGHWAKECRQPGGGAYKQGNNKPQFRNPGKSTFNRFMGPNPNNKRNNARAHAAIDSNDTPMQPNDSFAFSASDNEDSFFSRPGNQWIADSGTTTHIARDRSFFDDYRDAQVTDHGLGVKMDSKNLQILSPDGNTIAVRFDNGGEFVNQNWKAHTTKAGTVLETTAPYSSQQNGIAERLNRTLLEHARAMMLESDAPKFLWSEAVAYACYLKNRVPTQVHGVFQSTPYEQFWGIKPDVSLLRPWGAKCYVLDQAVNRSKLDPKAFKAVFTGISDVQGKSWRYYKPNAMKILHSRNVAFIRDDDTMTNNEDEVLIPIAPPAEGEIKKNSEESSKSEQLTRNTGTGGDTKPIKAKVKDEAESPSTPIPFDSVQSTTKSSPTVSSLLEPLATSSTTHTSTSQPSKVVRTLSRMLKSSGANLGAKPQGPSRPPAMSKPGATIQTRSARAGQPLMRLESTRGAPKVTIMDDKGDLPITAHTGSQLTEDSAAEDNEDTETANVCVNDPYADMPPLERIYPLKHTIDLPPLVPIPPEQLHRSQDSLTATLKAKENAFTSAFYEGFTHQTFMTRTDPEGDNPSYEDAMNGPERDKWLRAMQEEYDQLVQMKTFELTSPPSDKNIIQNKWVLTRKRDQDGNIARYKARLVAKGFTQIPGQDFYDTFAPIAHLDSLRILCSLANWYNLDIHQLDVVSAFLNGELNEELYMRQIPGFDDGLGTVLRLNRSLYGLKQAGHVWNKYLDAKLKSLGYSRLLTDSCVYRRIRRDGDGYFLVSFLAVHVDDCVLVTTPHHTYDAINELRQEFDMRDLGELRHFIGIQFTRDRANRTLTLSQPAYILNIVDEAGLLGAYPADTPASTSTQLMRNTGPKPNYPYARMIGRLMYAAICTRPDIAYIVNHLASFTTCYGQPHVTALKRIIRYLAGTVSHGLVYRRYADLSTDEMGEVSYSDADWGSNLLDRKSISGNCFLLGGASVSWSSKKQPTVALSTMEAEYMALAHASTQALWIRQFFDEINMPSSSPTLILSDNLAALTLSVESQYRGRSKHIDIRHHFIRDCVEKRWLSPMYVNTKDNFADALTKPLPANQFHILMEGIMGEQEERDMEII
ncbi:Retrovirus-related Pol polyprotein from transposon TNT 1-94 [Ceratobasidium sp. AG-Ba]|nr:Retrovirus-related Pol polyprotein from transposon TNT 1-94 [Ceratobasidium sp. AG-Ba]